MRRGRPTLKTNRREQSPYSRKREGQSMSTLVASVPAMSAGAIEVIPTGAALGATVRGIDLRTVDETAFARIVQAWHDHSVLLFHDQSLSDHDLIAFSRRLGDLDWAPVQETGQIGRASWRESGG